MTKDFDVVSPGGDRPIFKVSEQTSSAVTFIARIFLCMAVVIMTSFASNFSTMGYPVMTAIVDLGAGLILFVLLVTWIK